MADKKPCYGDWCPDIHDCENCQELKECRSDALARAEYADRQHGRWPS